MFRAVIIEDERPAVESLVHLLSSVAKDLKVIAILNSVGDSVNFFSGQPAVDLIFCDVQLKDGCCFEIFNHGDFYTPVIFVTGFDHFIVQAFENRGIDYLLKPVDKKRLEKAMDKFRMLDKHFTHQSSMKEALHAMIPVKKKRIIVKQGTKNISLPLEEIVLFHAENKWVHAIDLYGNKYIADKNLSELEQELDKHLFFRANRQYIIHLKFIHGFTMYDRVKIKIQLTVPRINHIIIVSQEMAPLFREWMFKA